MSNNKEVEELAEHLELYCDFEDDEIHPFHKAVTKTLKKFINEEMDAGMLGCHLHNGFKRIVNKEVAWHLVNGLFDQIGFDESNHLQLILSPNIDTVDFELGKVAKPFHILIQQAVLDETLDETLDSHANYEKEKLELVILKYIEKLENTIKLVLEYDYDSKFSEQVLIV